MTAPLSPEGLFAAVLSAQPSHPLVTYYDEFSGERTELSARSLSNWVAKTHFLLMDGLGLGVGDVAFVDLPAHWISVPAILGCWTAGLEVSTDPARADVAFVGPASLARADGIADVFAVAPDSAAVGFGADVPAGAQDYVMAVRPQADAWASVRPPAGPDDPALDGSARAAVAAEAVDVARRNEWSAGARILTTRPWRDPQDWVETLLAPMAVTGSLVMVRGGDLSTVQRRREQERATILA